MINPNLDEVTKVVIPKTLLCGFDENAFLVGRLGCVQTGEVKWALLTFFSQFLVLNFNLEFTSDPLNENLSSGIIYSERYKQFDLTLYSLIYWNVPLNPEPAYSDRIWQDIIQVR